MNAIIASPRHAAAARLATGSGEISFEKIGSFEQEEFIKHCMAAASIHVDRLFIDIASTDEASLRIGIEQYRTLRPETAITIVALDRKPTDPLVVALAKNGFDIHMTPAGNPDQDEEEARPGAMERIASALEQSNRLDSPDALLMDLPDVPVQERVLIQERIIGSVIISVVGTEPKAGSTHQSIAVAHYLARLGKSVALVEANASGDFAAIEAAYEGIKGYVGQGHTFEIGKVTYYKRASKDRMAALMSEDYDYIVLDIGSYEDSEWLEEFARSDVQLVVTAGIEWRQDSLAAFVKANAGMDASKWKIVVPMSDSLSVGDIQKANPKLLVAGLPYQPDPFQKQKDGDAAFDRLLNRYIGEKKKASSKGLLYGLIGGCFVVIIVLAALLILK